MTGWRTASFNLVFFLLLCSNVNGTLSKKETDADGAAAALSAAAAASLVAAEQAPKIWPASTVLEEYTTSQEAVLRTVAVATFRYTVSPPVSLPDEVMIQQSWKRFHVVLNKLIPASAQQYPINPEKVILSPLRGVRITVNHSVADDAFLVNADESYDLRIPGITKHNDETGERGEDDQDVMIEDANFIILSAASVVGVLRGLQTLWQLFEFGWLDGHSSNDPIFIVRHTPIHILDGPPAYSYRGLMIDTSRHYLPVPLIEERLLDALEWNKINVLHWHLTDSQSWPYESAAYPELSEQGAYRACARAPCVYRPSEIRRIVEQARLRGIRVIVEVDLPGHTQAIGASHPEWLTDCPSQGGGPMEPLNVTNEAVYDFVNNLYAELVILFPDPLIHIGGDEVYYDCWNHSAQIQQWMQDHEIDDLDHLWAYFQHRLMNAVKSVRKRPIVWQEVFDQGVNVDQDTIVDVWKDWQVSTRAAATKQGLNVILSACWYLDHLGETWLSFYDCDPRDFNASAEQKSLVLGGHASMWGEHVDENNFFSLVWPRLSAVAERLWTGNRFSGHKDKHVEQRLHQFRCKMVQLGIPATPVMPGSCPDHAFASASADQPLVE